ncbi:uncharacterized protein si:ch211-214j8.12 isoform X2 [Acanthopagrus latus]|uniref:uncharacterized protein si:ch211-214j8.12 isoform X2 n=1 Tax=Acanthopagrus latus TaxID=8177 RepID=UPI00187C8EAB|nr:uncharacterized protein si:ch211-214j8.12 isoform X2 [Acanthopagrus latus]
MPLFQASGGGPAHAKPAGRTVKKFKFRGTCEKTDEDGAVYSLTRLSLLSLADNMKDVWVKDYADNYMDHYSFRYIMGPFNLLRDLVQELMSLLCSRKQMTRAALHLLLVPQLRVLSMEKCCSLVSSALCPHIAARCQSLRSLDLTGAQQLPSKVLSETLSCLPALRSLSLAGTPCDRCVIRAITSRCRFLRHLDVSRCHFLSPAALLPLGGGVSFSSPGCTTTSQPSAPLSPLPLSSLLALDTGFGEQEGDPVAVAAYLLLSLPGLERVAMDGLAQACRLIQHREFKETDEFTDREGIPRLEEVWEGWRHRQGMDSCRGTGEGAEAADEEDEEGTLLEGYGSESEGDEGPSGPEEKGRVSQSGNKHPILRLKDVSSVSCDSLDSISRLCPHIHSLSVNVDDYEGTRGRSQRSLLATGLQMWSDQLRSLSLHYSGPLVDLLPALQVAGSSLLSLTLEGVKTSPHTPLLEVIRACPRLRDLHISAEPPTVSQIEEIEEDQQDDRDLPRLPDLCSLTLKFSYEHSQMRPVMSWMSLKRALRCLLAGSPRLEKLSLVSLPCSLDRVLQDVQILREVQPLYVSVTDLPLGRVQHIEVPRTDVRTETVKSIMLRSKRLRFVDVSCCWQISHSGWLDCKAFRKVEVVWS